MNQYLPIIVAIISAGFAGYLAIVKSKRELIWTERYKAIKDVIEANKIAYEYFTEIELDIAGVSSQLKGETDKLNNVLGEEILKLRSGSVKMHLFFNGILGKYLVHRIWLVESAIFDYLNTEPYENDSDYINQISVLARENIAIYSMVQKTVSVNFLPTWMAPDYWKLKKLAGRYYYADDRFGLPEIA